MNEDIFEPFEQSTPPQPKGAAEPAPQNGAAKPKRRASNGAKAVAKPKAQAAPAEAPKRRRGRQPKSTAAPAARSPTFDLATVVAACAGMQPDEAALLSKIALALQKQPKKKRARIGAAIGKLFG